MQLTGGFVLVMLATVVAVTGMLVVRRRVNLQELVTHHDVADSFLSVIGTLYAVLLGFLIVDALDRFEQARVTVESEANALADVYRLAHALPPPHGETIEKSCVEYARAVITDEWKSMEDEQSSPKAQEAINRMWKEVLTFKPSDDRENAIYSQLLSEASQLGDNRRTRLVTARMTLSPFMWIVLGCGGIFTIVVTYFFGLKNTRSQIIMTVLLALTLGLNIFLLGIYNAPFSGDLRVGTEAFELSEEIFKWHKHNPIPRFGGGIIDTNGVGVDDAMQDNAGRK